MTVYGYCRISRKTQNIERQVRNILAAYPAAHIVKEAYTGTKVEGRKEFDKVLKTVCPGDMIVFDSVSRMSRNAEDGFKLYQQLYEKGVSLVFLKEPHINTETYKKALAPAVPMTNTNVDCILQGVNQYLLRLAEEQIRLAFIQSQKEVDDLHQRTVEGLLTAKMNGKRVGQPKGAILITKKSVAAKEIIQKHNKDFGGTLDDAETIKLAEISRNSFYKYKKELREELV